MTNPTKQSNFDQMLPSDEQLIQRQKIWQNIFTKYNSKNDIDDDGILLEELDNLSDLETEDYDNDDSCGSEAEYVNKQTGDDVNCDLEDSATNCISAIQRRVENWNKSGFRLNFNSYLFNEPINNWWNREFNASANLFGFKNELSAAKITTMTIREISYSTTTNLTGDFLCNTALSFDKLAYNNISRPLSVQRQPVFQPTPMIDYYKTNNTTQNESKNPPGYGGSKYLPKDIEKVSRKQTVLKHRRQKSNRRKIANNKISHIADKTSAYFADCGTDTESSSSDESFANTRRPTRTHPYHIQNIKNQGIIDDNIDYKFKLEPVVRIKQYNANGHTNKDSPNLQIENTETKKEPMKHIEDKMSKLNINKGSKSKEKNTNAIQLDIDSMKMRKNIKKREKSQSEANANDLSKKPTVCSKKSSRDGDINALDDKESQTNHKQQLKQKTENKNSNSNLMKPSNCSDQELLSKQQQKSGTTDTFVIDKKKRAVDQVVENIDLGNIFKRPKTPPLKLKTTIENSQTVKPTEQMIKPIENNGKHMDKNGVNSTIRNHPVNNAAELKLTIKENEKVAINKQKNREKRQKENSPKQIIVVYSPSKQMNYNYRESDNTVSISVTQLISTVGMDNMLKFHGDQPFRKIRTDADKELLLVFTKRSNRPKFIRRL